MGLFRPFYPQIGEFGWPGPDSTSNTVEAIFRNNENAKLCWIQTSGTFENEILDLNNCTKLLDKRPKMYQIGLEKAIFHLIAR